MADESKAVELGEEVWAEWDNDGDLYLFTSDNGVTDSADSEIWMNPETVAALKEFLATKGGAPALSDLYGDYGDPNSPDSQA